MKIDVGTQLKWKNRSMVVTSICKTTELRYAPRSSLEMRDWLLAGNVHVIQLEAGDFAQGDLIQVDLERIELTAIGSHIEHIYTYHKSRRKDGHNADEELDRKTSASKAEGSGEGSESGKGSGEEGAGVDG